MPRRFRSHLVASRNFRRNHKMVSLTLGRRRRFRNRWRSKGWI